jgi:hypothetical protein
MAKISVEDIRKSDLPNQNDGVTKPSNTELTLIKGGSPYKTWGSINVGEGNALLPNAPRSLGTTDYF